MEKHPFDEALALQPEGEDLWRGHTHPAWANMIGPYGGITAAQMLQGVLQHPRRIGEPVALTVNYAAALADGPFLLRAQPARTNRSTQHWMLELRQQDQVVGTGTAMTAVRRATWGGHEAPMPQVPAPETVERTVRSQVPWLERYAMRFIEGGIPAQWNDEEQETSLTRMWVRDVPARPLDHASLAAVADVFFPRIWLRRARHVPLGTVTMTVYFHATPAALQAAGTGHLLAQVRGQGFGNGYFDHSGQLWNEAGDLLATTHQLVYYKE